MNVLFLSLVPIKDIGMSGIYSDLLRKFHQEGHHVCIVSPSERRNKQKTFIKKEKGVDYLNVWIFNCTKTNIIEKGFSTLLIEYQYKCAIKKYFSDIKFDLILYATPPITFANVVKYIKKRDGALSYLMLKDIFPQNAVDLNLIKESGIVHRYFKAKEHQLYKLSDFIGCMSPANISFLLGHNPWLEVDKVELCPNSMEIHAAIEVATLEKQQLLAKYHIPIGKKLYIYGGNLGKPQAISYVIECLKREKNNSQAYFIIVGSGTEYHLVEEFIQSNKSENVKLLPYMQKEDFDRLVACCDAGLIFLDYRFTIPNYPSRLLSYMSAGIPIIAATDKNTDIGSFLESNGIGIWCESNDAENFHIALQKLSNLSANSQKIRKVLKDYYNVDVSYNIIIKHFNDYNS